MLRWLKGMLVHALLMGAVAGCAALFPPPPRGVSFQSTPPGAAVSLDGIGIGSTPVTFPVSCASPREVVFTREGYHAYRQTIPTVSGWDHRAYGTLEWPVNHCAPVVSVVLAPLQGPR